MKVFASWSGGKDCTLATYKAIAAGHEVVCLLNFISEDGERSASHGIKASVLALQAKAIGIPMIQVKTSWEGYEGNFKKAMGVLKETGVEGGVFGDIYLQEHKDWIERVCNEAGMQTTFPLWGSKTLDLILEFIDLGFESLVVATKLEESLLGKKLDRNLINRLIEMESDPCGEGGEYHTLVTAGPIFHNKRLEIVYGKREMKDGVWFLDVSPPATG
ncbi:MAG: diphthine--ammonia ligase [Dehalococcoidia bacterium]|nr:diphthine--ammonia ligase [Dehalococcoidia bacterium]